ncbi:hypothetical protein GCM10009633_28840 [Janibacter melonis]
MPPVLAVQRVEDGELDDGDAVLALQLALHGGLDEPVERGERAPPPGPDLHGVISDTHGAEFINDLQ